MAGLFGVLLWHMGTGGLADDSCGCCGRGRVVASDVFPVSLPAAGVRPGLPCGPGSFFKCVCRGMRRMPEAGVRLARCAGNASLCMRGPADAGRLYRCPVSSAWVVYAAAYAKEWIA